MARSPAVAPAPSPTPTARLHHLDALRGGALLLGVLLHALMPFAPGDLWLVSDDIDSMPAILVVAVIHLFRMVLFMMLAGYFGSMVLHRRGAGAYLRDRLTRIGLPLVAFWPGLFALMVAALVLNGAVRDLGPVAAPQPAAGSPTGLLALPTMHLWFLLLLLEIVVVVLALRAVTIRVLGAERAGNWSAAISSALASPFGVLLAAVPYAAGLLLQGDGLASITEPYTLVPVPGASVAYAGAFLTGWFLRARPEALPRLEGRWIPHLIAAAVLSTAVILVPPGAPALLIAVVAALAGWTWVYGLLGLSARLVRREIPAVRYLADASYWIYLVHFPLLLLVEIPLAELPLPLLVKLPVALAGVLAVLLLSYDLLVRSTWVGAWLNGHRRPRALGRRRAAREPRADAALTP